MSGVVSFDYGVWAMRYPELAGSVVQPLAALYFAEATLYCDNTACSPIEDLGVRALLLNMATAHVAALNAPVNGQAPSPLVGRINSATQGSVTVQAQNDYPPGTVQWWQATRYGAAFWAATQQYRTARYVPGHKRSMQPYIGGYRRG